MKYFDYLLIDLYHYAIGVKHGCMSANEPDIDPLSAQIHKGDCVGWVKGREAIDL